MFTRIRLKLPTRNEALPVFSTILFIVFSWMFFQFFIQVPSWIFYMDAQKLLVMFTYVVSFSLAESLILMGFVVFLDLVFPRRMFKEQFIAQGTVQVLIISIITYFIRQRIELFEKLEIVKLLTIPVVALAVILLSVLLSAMIFKRFEKAPRLIESLADRMTIFAYLYLPLGVASLAVVVLRNIIYCQTN